MLSASSGVVAISSLFGTLLAAWYGCFAHLEAVRLGVVECPVLARLAYFMFEKQPL